MSNISGLSKMYYTKSIKYHAAIKNICGITFISLRIHSDKLLYYLYITWNNITIDVAA